MSVYLFLERLATTWMDLECIMLNGIRQTKTNIRFHLYVGSKKHNKKQNRNRPIDAENKHGCQMAEDGGVS